MRINTTFVAINRESSEFCANGREFDNHSDAYLAALTDGKGCFERDADGYMRATENGGQIYSGGSFNRNDQAAKDEVVREIVRNLDVRSFRFDTLKVVRDSANAIIRIDDSDDADLIAYWNQRIGAPALPAPRVKG